MGLSLHGSSAIGRTGLVILHTGKVGFLRLKRKENFPPCSDGSHPYRKNATPEYSGHPIDPSKALWNRIGKNGISAGAPLRI